jgi:hypothetical protein
VPARDSESETPVEVSRIAAVSLDHVRYELTGNRFAVTYLDASAKRPPPRSGTERRAERAAIIN